MLEKDKESYKKHLLSSGYKFLGENSVIDKSGSVYDVHYQYNHIGNGVYQGSYLTMR